MTYLAASVLLASVIFALSTSLFILYLHIYGIVLGFKRRWYFGVVALMVPWFAVIVAGAKFFFKKDLLK